MLLFSSIMRKNYEKSGEKQKENMFFFAMTGSLCNFYIKEERKKWEKAHLSPNNLVFLHPETVINHTIIIICCTPSYSRWPQITSRTTT